MADTKGDNESTSGEVTMRDTDEEVDKDQADNNDENDDRNKVDDGDVEAQAKATVEEENAGIDETNDVADADNDDGDKNDEEGERDEGEAAAEDEEVEQDDVGHSNKPEESATTDADDNTEAELQEDDDDDDAHQEETEENNEKAAVEEEGQTEADEGEEEGAEEEDQVVIKTSESLEEDNIQQNGSSDLTEEDKTRCRYMFEKKAINGRLDLKGFKTVFRVLGEILASDDAERMFEAGDRDDDDTLDFDEFFRLYAKFRQEEQARREAILDSLDKLFLCGSGDTIELKKVEQLLLKLQQPDLDIRLVREKSDLGEDEVKQMIKSLDKTGTGFIPKEEFVDIMCQHLEI